MKFWANRSLLRASWRCASASAAWSLASCALALVTLTSSLRASSVNSSWPALTNWPSRMCTLVIVLAICGRISTLFSAVTVPVASSITSTSRFCTETSVTLTGGPPLPDAAEPGAPGVPAASAASPVAAPRVNMKAAAAAATTATPAIAKTSGFFTTLDCDGRSISARPCAPAVRPFSRTAGRAEAAAAALAGIERLDHPELRLDHRHDHQLGDPLERLHGEGRGAAVP